MIIFYCFIKCSELLWGDDALMIFINFEEPELLL